MVLVVLVAQFIRARSLQHNNSLIGGVFTFIERIHEKKFINTMAEQNTPSWLSGGGGGDNSMGGGGGGMDSLASGVTMDAGISASGVNNTTSIPVPVPPPSSSTAVSADDSAELPGIILTMRLVNMGVAAAIIAISIIEMIGIPSISTLVLGVYATCGGVLICCLETQLKFVRVIIAVNFGFLFNSVWRFLFYILLGSVALSYDDLLGRIVALAFISVAIFNTYVLCRYPSYRKMREKIAEEEDKRIESRISKEVKKQAARQIMKS